MPFADEDTAGITIVNNTSSKSADLRRIGIEIKSAIPVIAINTPKYIEKYFSTIGLLIKVIVNAPIKKIPIKIGIS